VPDPATGAFRPRTAVTAELTPDAGRT
jgi:hypothetical protein